MRQAQCPYPWDGGRCNRPLYRDHGFCIFHSIRTEAKEGDFRRAFEEHVKECTKKEAFYDFRGFVFPNVSLIDRDFSKPVDFKGCKFTDASGSPPVLRELLGNSWLVELPPALEAKILDYLHFFTKIVRETTGSETGLRTRREGPFIRIRLLTYEMLPEFIRHVENIYRKPGEPLAGLASKLAAETHVRIASLLREYGHVRGRFESGEVLPPENDAQLARIREITESPAALLPVTDRTPEMVFFLRADLWSFRKAPPESRAQAGEFLAKEEEKARKNAHCQWVRLEGDCIKVFFNGDAPGLLRFAQELTGDFDSLCIPGLPGFRIFLSCGICEKIDRCGHLGFSGRAISLADRADRVMKRRILDRKEERNQIWCTSEFREKLGADGAELEALAEADTTFHRHVFDPRQ